MSLDLLHLKARFNTTHGLTLPAVPSWLTLNRDQNKLTGTASVSIRGSYPVELMVDDYKNTTWRYQLLVDIPNSASSYQGNTTLVIPIDGLISLETVARGFSDPEGDTYQFALAATPKPPLWLVLNPQTGIVSATMLSGYQGSYTVNVTATDECGGNPICGQVGWQLFRVIVPNRDPYYQFDLANPDTIQLGVDGGIQYAIPSDTIVDPDGDRVTWAARLANGSALPAGITFSSTTRILRANPAAGVYHVSILAEDGSTGRANQTLTIVANSQPQANMTDVVITMPGIRKPFAWALPATAMFDADDDPITFSLVRTNPEFLVPSWLSFNGTTLAGTPTANNHQRIKLLLQGRDPHEGVGQMPIALAIKNLAPIAQIELPDPEILQVGERLSYAFPSDTFVDPEGDGLQYRALATTGDGRLPDFLTFNPITRTLFGTSLPESAGRYAVVFQVDDSYGGVANSSVIQLHINTQPRVDLQKWELTAEGINKAFVSMIPLTAMVDVDGDAITYELVNNDPRYLIPSWLSFNGTALMGSPDSNNHQVIQLLLVRHPFCKFH